MTRRDLIYRLEARMRSLDKEGKKAAAARVAKEQFEDMS